MDVFGNYKVEKLEDDRFLASPAEEYVLLDQRSEPVRQLLTAEVRQERVSSVELYDAFIEEFFDNGVPQYGLLEQAERELLNEGIDAEYPADLGLVETVEEELEKTYNYEL